MEWSVVRTNFSEALCFQEAILSLQLTFSQTSSSLCNNKETVNLPKAPFKCLMATTCLPGEICFRCPTGDKSISSASWLCITHSWFYVHGIIWFFQVCCSLLPLAVINTMTKGAWGGKGLFQLPVHHEGKSGQESRAGTWRQEFKQGPWRYIASWLAPSGWLSQCITHTRIMYLGMAPCTVHGALSHINH